MQTGFSAPSRSMTAATVICTPPLTSSTSVSVAVIRIRAPTGTGAGKRTLFSP
jgi:hypothetical protein